ncbi:GNAT family N-acetyltransferase [Flavobacterium salilacus subsp. salilacus]|uniref:GNAT family N-acetyltransferase n=1 Tax=Flavobacterium TaxID=237 RepID=UPI001075022D|nr:MULTISPECIES: GNAT family N-acetyltransferase [Flavobacterium]KAF2518290.1 GNAT family N-acetyltransferase [Flavobacterium salilacus subsp. salilacus]MBE1615298.1 GNAT family N-acetyltransferase [Flavobacterium sp. SaA2.13]
MSFLQEECTLRLLNQNLLSGSNKFSCGDRDLDDFFINDCEDYSNQLMGKSYCFTLNQDSSQIVCSFTLSNDSIKTNFIPKSNKNKLNRKIPNAKRMRSYPGVLIGRLGVNQDFVGKGIGRELMDFIKAWFIDSANKTGCRYLVVDAYNREKPISYYEKNGFQFLFNNEEEEKTYAGLNTNDILNTRLMYFDLIVLKA